MSAWSATCDASAMMRICEHHGTLAKCSAYMRAIECKYMSFPTSNMCAFVSCLLCCCSFTFGLTGAIMIAGPDAMSADSFAVIDDIDMPTCKPCYETCMRCGCFYDTYFGLLCRLCLGLPCRPCKPRVCIIQKIGILLENSAIRHMVPRLVRSQLPLQLTATIRLQERVSQGRNQVGPHLEAMHVGAPQ